MKRIKLTKEEREIERELEALRPASGEKRRKIEAVLSRARKCHTTRKATKTYLRGPK